MRHLLLAVALWLPAAAMTQESLDAASDLTFRGVRMGDLAGWSVEGRGDINGDGFADLIVGIPFADPTIGGATRNGAGQTFVIYGRATGLPAVELTALTPAQGYVINGALAGAGFGLEVSASDLSGDGIDDVITAAPSAPAVVGHEGLVAVVFGRTGEHGSVDLAPYLFPDGRTLIEDDVPNNGEGFLINGAGFVERIGYSLAGNQDFNGDGFDDLLIGNDWGLSGFNSDRGSIVSILYGRRSESDWPGRYVISRIRSEPESGAGIALREQIPSSGFGRSVAGVGDLNGDGIDDYAISADLYEADQEAQGAVFLFVGQAAPASAEFELADEEAPSPLLTTILGAAADDRVGSAVAGAGDFNGDGFADIVIGANGAGDGAGAAYVVFGRAQWPAVIDLGNLTGGLTLDGPAGGAAGASVAGGADLDGDGLDDVAVGAPLANDLAGRAYVVHGGTTDSRPLGGGRDRVFASGVVQDFVGRMVRFTADLTGDGSDDLFVGARNGSGVPEEGGLLHVVSGDGGADLVARTADLSHALYDPRVPGQGVLMEYGTADGQDIIFAAWYTFAQGVPIWLVTEFVPVAGESRVLESELFIAAGTGFGDAFDPDEVDIQPWGTVRIEQADCGEVTWSYTRNEDGAAGQLHLVPALADLLELDLCDAAAPTGSNSEERSRVAGTWWNPARSGEGILLDLETRGDANVMFFSWFTYVGNVQTWLVGSGSYDSETRTTGEIEVFTASGANFGGQFDPADVTLQPWGTVQMRFPECGAAAIDYAGQFPGAATVSGMLDLVRFTEGLAEIACEP